MGVPVLFKGENMDNELMLRACRYAVSKMIEKGDTYFMYIPNKEMISYKEVLIYLCDKIEEIESKNI